MENSILFLTPKQKETLDFIKKFTTRNGFAPLITELSKNFELKSLRSVTQRLEALEAKGLIKRDRFKHRGITIIKDTNLLSPEGTIRVPVIASAGCDQMEIYAQEKSDEYVSVDKKIIGSPKDIVAIKAVGNSMIDAGIFNGDYVLVEVRNDASENDRVVAIIGDMAVIKRFHRRANVVILQPESKNGGYSPIIMSEDSKIFGKVLSVIQVSKPQEDYQLLYEPGEKPKI
jgi:repressor LexA